MSRDSVSSPAAIGGGSTFFGFCQDSQWQLAVERNYCYPGADVLVVCLRVADALPPLRFDHDA